MYILPYIFFIDHNNGQNDRINLLLYYRRDSVDKNDSILIEKLENLIVENPTYWDFKEAKKEHIHGICSYPATMVPEMQAEVLRIIKEINPGINSILDPFMGSGTVLVEGMLNNLDVYGIDINPLAYLLSNFT